MMTIDRLKSLEDLRYVGEYFKTESYQLGEDAAIDHFKEIYENNGNDGIWNDDMVEFYGPKTFTDYDEENDITIKTWVYESYVDSGSIDYFTFSFETEL